MVAASDTSNQIELGALARDTGGRDAADPVQVQRSSSRASDISQHSVSSFAPSIESGHHAPSHPLPQTTSPTPTTAATKPRSPAKTSNQSAWRISWWWWWELGAALLSMSAIFSITIILATFQDRPLGDWKLSIQINSLISTLTTIGKTAMLVAVAESISQLKWLYFYKRTAPLDHFQDFDDASRGPWGSATLLWSTNFKAILASLGAIITICGLAIEPMAQQVLDFPTRNITLTNETATLGIADTYYSKAFQGSGDSTGDFDITGVVGSSDHLLAVADVNLACPLNSAECTWPAFSTLGVCGSSRNITNFERNCTYYNPTLICDYISPEFPEFANTRRHRPEDTRAARMLYDPMTTPSNNRSHIYATYLQQDRHGFVSIKTKDRAHSSRNGTIAPPVDIEYVTWDYCIRDYEPVKAVGSSITENRFSSEPVWPRDEKVDAQDSNGSTTSYHVYVGNTTGREVRVAENTEMHLWLYLTNPLNTTLIKQDSRWSNVNSENLDYGNYLLNGNMTEIASNIANTLTHEIRSSNLDGQMATLLTGEVFASETYIDVRWGWLVLPLAETFLATMLLLSSIVISWRRPLWKSSAIAPYLHPLKGWDEKDLMVKGYESSGAMERLAKDVNVSLDADENGRLRMLRR